MKKWIVIGAIILVAANIYFFWMRSQKSLDSTIASTSGDSKIMWGMLTNAFAINAVGEARFDETKIDQQISIMKDLGVTAVLVPYEFFGSKAWEGNDIFIQKLHDANFTIVLGLGDGYDFKKSYQTAYNVAKDIAQKHKDTIDYYQLLNEVDGTAIKKDYSGFTFNDYEPAKYQELKTILSGLTDGIKAGDPSAKRIITAHWLGVGMIDQLIKDKVNFEIVGWHWFSDMGNDPTHIVINGQSTVADGTSFDLPKHFVDQGKQFWITEVNRQLGSFPNNEKDQADYIKQVADAAQKTSNISAFFIYKLTDGADNIGKAGWGVYKTKPAGATVQFDAPKQAFTVYKDIIKNSAKK